MVMTHEFEVLAYVGDDGWWTPLNVIPASFVEVDPEWRDGLDSLTDKGPGAGGLWIASAVLAMSNYGGIDEPPGCDYDYEVVSWRRPTGAEMIRLRHSASTEATNSREIR